MNTKLQRTLELIENIQAAREDGDSGLTSAELDNLMERAQLLKEVFSDNALEF